MSGSNEDEKTSIQAVLPDVPKVAARKSAYLLIISTKTQTSTGRMFKLEKPESVMGRSDEADVQLLDEGISRNHAKVLLTADGDAQLVDMGSTNGTFVNGERVQLSNLKDGDKVQVGSTTVLLFSLQDELEEHFQRTIYEAATRDGLTQVHNKKYFLERLRKEFAYCTRHRVPLALVMLDVDLFKRINDTYGHQAGDRVLVHITKRINETIRTEDLFARYGGEEFALLLHDVPAEDARICAERCRLVVERSEILLGEKSVKVTISLGVANLLEGAFAQGEDMIAEADRRLYVAKREGRNRVIVSG